MTEYVYRVTIAVPEADVADANELALVLGNFPADGSTFRNKCYRCAGGNTYYLTSTLARQSFVDGAQTTLAAPDHAPDADLMAAGDAQAKLAVYQGEGEVPQAATDKIVAYVGANTESALDHIAAMGLTKTATEI